MINENEAVTILSDYLISQGYIINQQLDTKTKGIDIIAQKGKKKLFIEVKGGTPTSPTSKNYGKPFYLLSETVNVRQWQGQATNSSINNWRRFREFITVSIKYPLALQN